MSAENFWKKTRLERDQLIATLLEGLFDDVNNGVYGDVHLLSNLGGIPVIMLRIEKSIIHSPTNKPIFFNKLGGDSLGGILAIRHLIALDAMEYRNGSGQSYSLDALYLEACRNFIEAHNAAVN